MREDHGPSAGLSRSFAMTIWRQENAMKAGVATPAGLALRDDVPRPQPKPNEVLVKVHAAGMNRADLNSARGAGGHGAVGAVIGIEFAGEVVEAGAEVKGLKRGDRVACSGTGGYAEYAVADWGRVIAIPGNLDFEKAATFPIGLYTLHNALKTAGRMKAGESDLIQGASSGVGLMGLQIAKTLGAKRVIGTSTNAERRARLKEFGADLALDTTAPDWVDQVLEATQGKGVDLVVDMVSGPLVSETMRATAVLGRIVNVGRLGGMKAEFDFDRHAARRIDYIGVTFRTRSLEEVREIGRLAKADLLEAVTSGKIGLPIDRTFRLDEAVAAQDYMRANRHFGKILLLP
jgi:NADPH2:quinone reductase